MEYVFGERTATVFKRFMEVNCAYAEKRMKTVNEEESEIEKERLGQHPIHASHSLWSIEIFFYEDRQFDDDSDEEFYPVGASFRIYRTDDDHEHFLYVKSIKTYEPSVIDNLVKTHTACKDCGRWELVNDSAFCRECYPFTMTHGEDCCCCLERSEGIWVKLPCTHMMHKRCWLAIKHEHESCGCHVKRKCPLCRTLFGCKDAVEC